MQTSCKQKACNLLFRYGNIVVTPFYSDGRKGKEKMKDSEFVLNKLAFDYVFYNEQANYYLSKVKEALAKSDVRDYELWLSKRCEAVAVRHYILSFGEYFGFSDEEFHNAVEVAKTNDYFRSYFEFIGEEINE